MSGLSLAEIRMSRIRQARQQLAPLAKRLESLASVEAASSEGRQVAADLARSIEELRKELATFTTSGAVRGTMLGSLQSAKACVDRLAGALANDPTDVATCLQALNDLMAGKPGPSLSEAKRQAELVIERVVRGQAARTEARKVTNIIRGMLAAPAASAGSSAAPQQAEASRRYSEELARVASDAVRTEMEALRQSDAEEMRLGGLDAGRHAATLAAAKSAINAGKIEEAAQRVDDARQQRVAATNLAAERRLRIAMRDELASSLARTLEERHYDRCDSYLQPGAGGEERPLVIYAHNPSGTAHVRVTLMLDGELKIEVDGVPEGEEQVCVDVFEAFQRAVGESGDEFRMVDAGRAAPFLHRERERVVERRRERESGR
jgi:hypothetical protein